MDKNEASSHISLNNQSALHQMDGFEFRQKPYRWIILGLLWLLYSVFGLISRSIFPLVTPILRDLDISYAQMGFILGSWQLTYIPAALAAGAFLDKWGARKCLLAGAVLMALSAGLRYFSNGFLSMLFCVALFGAGGPMISIGGPKTISEWFSGRSRSTAVGIYMVGPGIGGFLALALTNSLVMPLTGYSWRLTFVCYGVLAMVIGVFWWLLAQDTQAVQAEGKINFGEVFGSLIKVRNVQILLVMALFSFAIGHGFSSWLPKILEIRGLSASDAGFTASISFVTSIPAVLLVPRLVPSRLRGRIIALFALWTLINIFVIVNTSGVFLIAGLLLLGVSASCFMPLMILILMDSPEIDTQYMGSAGGIFFCVAEIGGFAGPFFMGVLVDATGTFLMGALFLGILCVAMSVLTFLLKTRALLNE
ncbi:MAG: MFS transporter [Deltaproteobacteria bacterium]|nr:MFS transporter [Deltaproteobacteria bacterium]